MGECIDYTKTSVEISRALLRQFCDGLRPLAMVSECGQAGMEQLLMDGMSGHWRVLGSALQKVLGEGVGVEAMLRSLNSQAMLRQLLG